MIWKTRINVDLLAWKMSYAEFSMMLAPHCYTISFKKWQYYKDIDGIVLIVKKFIQGNKTIMTIGWMTGSHLCYLLHNIHTSLRTQLRTSSCCIYFFVKPSYTSLQIWCRHILLQLQWNKLVYVRVGMSQFFTWITHFNNILLLLPSVAPSVSSVPASVSSPVATSVPSPAVVSVPLPVDVVFVAVFATVVASAAVVTVASMA